MTPAERRQRITDVCESAAQLRPEERDAFLTKLAAVRGAQGNDYIGMIRSLDRDARSVGTAWLGRVVDAVAEAAFACVPACRG